MRGRGGTGLYPESSAWSLTNVRYPTGVEEAFSYEHDYVDAKDFFPDGDFSEPEVNEVAIAYGRAVGSETASFHTEGGMYYFKKSSYCRTPCIPGPPEDDDYNARGPYQGGTRVTKIRRTASNVPTRTSEFDYTRARGIPSGIPLDYFRKIASNANNSVLLFKSAARSAASVYYDVIERTDTPSETITTSHYTMPDYTGGGGFHYNQTVSIRWDRTERDPSYVTAVSDNLGRTWGRRAKTVVEQPGNDDVPYEYRESRRIERYSNSVARQALPQVQFNRISYGQSQGSTSRLFSLRWGYADDVIMESDSVSSGGAPVASTRRYYRDTNFSRPNGKVPSNFVRRTVEWRTGREETLVTENTYAYDVPGYRNLRQRGILTPVVREDVYIPAPDDDPGPDPPPQPTELCFSRLPGGGGQPGGTGRTRGGTRVPKARIGGEGTLQREYGDVPYDGDCIIVPPPDEGEEDTPLGVAAMYRSSVTTWQSDSDLPALKPHQSYQWVAPEPTQSRPAFTSWGSGSPGDEWKLGRTFVDYDEHGRATEVLDASGARVALTYGEVFPHRLEEVTASGPDVQPLSQSFAYGPTGLLTQRTDENGGVWHYRYDAGGRLYEASDAHGLTTTSTAYKLTPNSAARRFVESVTHRQGTLLANGSFEAYKAGSITAGSGGIAQIAAWSVSNASLTTSGTATLGLRMLQLGPGGFAQQTTAALEAGQEVVLSLWMTGSGRVELGSDLEMVRTSGNLGPATVFGDEDLAYTVSASAGAWKHAWVHVRKTNEGPVEVGLRTNGGSSKWDAVSLTPVRGGLSASEVEDAIRPHAAVAFVNAYGHAVQAVDADGWYRDADERVLASTVDWAGRVTKAWLPYEYDTGETAASVYDGDFSENAENYYDGNPGPDADDKPYVKNEYYPGASERLVRTRPPGEIEGERGAVEHTYRAREFRVSPEEYLTLHQNETVDLDGHRRVVYTDLGGDVIIEDGFGRLPSAGTDAPDNLEFDFRRVGTGTTCLTGTGGTGNGGQCGYTFTAEATQYVAYEMVLSVRGDRSASARFQVFEDPQGTKRTIAAEGLANKNLPDWPGDTVRVTGGFFVFAGEEYEVTAQAANFDLFSGPPLPISSIAGVVRFRNDDGSIPAIIRTRYDRDMLGQTVAVHSPNAFGPPAGSSPDDWVTTYTLDTRGQVYETASPDAGTVRSLYDEAGRLRFSQDANEAEDGQVSVVCYDTLGRILRQGRMNAPANLNSLDPDADCPTSGVDWRLQQLYDLDEHGTLAATPFEAPPAVRNALTNTQSRLVASAYKSNEQWQVEFFAYDALGRVARRWVRTAGTTPEWEHATYRYDAVGNPVEERLELDGNELTHFYTYTLRGELKNVAVSTDGARPSTPDAEYTYNVRGALASEELGADVFERPYTYDVRGRLTDLGDVTNSSTPFAERLAYTPGGLIEQLTTFSPHAAQESAYGNDAKRDFLRYNFQYDELSRLLDADFSTGTSLGNIQNRSAFDVGNLTYDSNGNLLSLARFAPTASALNGELIDDLRRQNGQSGYGYENGTNRLAQVYDMEERTEDEPWDAEDTLFEYDANGNVTVMDFQGDNQAPLRYPNYDERNLPLTVETPDGEALQYRYSSAGQRIARYSADGTTADRYVRTGSGTTAALIDASTGGEGLRYWTIRGLGGRVIGRIGDVGLPAVRQLSGEITEARTFEASERIEVENGAIREPNGALTLRAGEAVLLQSDFIVERGAELLVEIDSELASGGGSGEEESRRYYVTDHLGSVRAVVTAGAEGTEVVEARDYYPWGLEMPGRTYVNGPVSRENYTGHELDEETDMLYAGARYYMPALGRWTAVDPLASEFPSWSPYNYVMNNPVGLTDPTGMAPDTTGSVLPSTEEVAVAAASATAKTLESRPGNLATFSSISLRRISVVGSIGLTAHEISQLPPGDHRGQLQSMTRLGLGVATSVGTAKLLAPLAATGPPGAALCAAVSACAGLAASTVGPEGAVMIRDAFSSIDLSSVDLNGESRSGAGLNISPESREQSRQERAELEQAQEAMRERHMQRRAQTRERAASQRQRSSSQIRRWLDRFLN